MSKHTEIPWEVHKHSHCDGEWWASIGHHGFGPIADIVGEEGNHTCQNYGFYQPVAELKYLVTPLEEQKANADFIVTACNCHDDLLKALKDLYCGVMNLNIDDTEYKTEDMGSKLGKADQAITKAKGGKP